MNNFDFVYHDEYIVNKVLNRHILKALSVLCGDNVNKPVHRARIALQIQGQMRNLRPITILRIRLLTSLRLLADHSIISKHDDNHFSIGRPYGVPEAEGKGVVAVNRKSDDNLAPIVRKKSYTKHKVTHPLIVGYHANNLIGTAKMLFIENQPSTPLAITENRPESPPPNRKFVFGGNGASQRYEQYLPSFTNKRIRDREPNTFDRMFSNETPMERIRMQNQGEPVVNKTEKVSQKDETAAAVEPNESVGLGLTSDSLVEASNEHNGEGQTPSSCETDSE